MSNLGDGRSAKERVSVQGWTEENMKTLWNSLFDVASVSTCNEGDEDAQGMAMLLATVLSLFKKCKSVKEAPSAPCDQCPLLQEACTKYKVELRSLQQKADLVDRIQSLMGGSSSSTASHEERTAALGVAMTQMLDTMLPDSSEDSQPKRKRSDRSPRRHKKPLFNLSTLANKPTSSQCVETRVEDDSQLEKPPSKQDDHPFESQKIISTLSNTLRGSPFQQLDTILALQENPSRKNESLNKLTNPTTNLSSPLKKIFSRSSEPEKDVIVLAPETLPEPPRAYKRSIVIPETMCSQILIGDSTDSDCDDTQMPFPVTPEKQTVEDKPIRSPIIGNMNMSAKLNRSFESRNSPKVQALHRVEKTPDVTSRFSVGSDGPSPSLLQDIPVSMKTSKVKPTENKVTEHVGGRLSLKNGAYRKARAKNEMPLHEIDDEIVELAGADSPKLEEKKGVVRREEKKTGSWQLKPTAEVQSITVNKSLTKLRQTKLSLVATTSNDLCSSREFNGGIRAAQTSTQISDEERDFEKAVMLSLIEAEQEENIESKLPTRSLDKSGETGQRARETEPDELLAEMALPSTARTRALIADFDKVPSKNKPEPAYAHQRDAVRKQSERQKLLGQDCPSCRQYYQAMNLTEEELQSRLNKCSKHRNNFQQPSTPPGYWDTNFPTTQELRERNIDVTQSGEPLISRKSRRQL